SSCTNILWVKLPLELLLELCQVGYGTRPSIYVGLLLLPPQHSGVGQALRSPLNSLGLGASMRASHTVAGPAPPPMPPAASTCCLRVSTCPCSAPPLKSYVLKGREVAFKNIYASVQRHHTNLCMSDSFIKLVGARTFGFFVCKSLADRNKEGSLPRLLSLLLDLDFFWGSLPWLSPWNIASSSSWFAMNDALIPLVTGLSFQRPWDS
ncbi:hypothetical protein HAX54_041330, partial [Datura stramonium]|nr:hypothetical protein [Datura stramonium]